MQDLKPKQKKTTLKKWRKRILVIILVIVFFPIGLFTVGWLNRDAVINALQDWYSENNKGTLDIGEVNARFISEFPNVGFTLKDIKQTAIDTIADTHSSIEIEETKLVISAANLIFGNFKFEGVKIKNAVITSRVISKKSLAYHQQLKYDKQREEPKGLVIPKWLHPDGISFSLENLKFVLKDSVLSKSFDLDIHSINGSYQGNDTELNGDFAMDLTVNKLGFNTKNGSFFNGARVTGKPTFKADLEKSEIYLPEFLFNVDEQTFNLIANFYLLEANNFKFKLKNKNTKFNSLKTLLAENLASKIEIFDIKKPIDTDLLLIGNFAYGNNPDIEAEFTTKNNDAVIGEQIKLTDLSFTGYLTNDIYTTDSLRLSKKSRKDVKIFVNTVDANIDDITVDINNSYFQSSPDALNFIEANINLQGKNETLAKLIASENFDFKDGTFQFKASVSGDIPKPYLFVSQSKGFLKIENTRVILKKNGLQLPINIIDLELDRENSILRQLKINLPQNETVILKGNLNNISSLLAKNPTVPTTSDIYLNSNKLNLNNVISISKKFEANSGKKFNDRKNISETLEVIYNQFRPSFKINIAALTYNNTTLNEVISKIDLVNTKTISLRQFNFNYYNTSSSLTGNVVVPESKHNFNNDIYINAKAKSQGSISVMEKLFNTQLFSINSGDYQFHGDITGNIKKLSEILNNAKGDLTLNNTKLYYAPSDLDIDIDSLSLLVTNSNLILNKFNLEIGENNPIKLTGKISQFPSFLMDNTKTNGSVFLNIKAPFINGNSVITAINSFKDDTKIETKKTKNALHQIFKDINSFNPKIELAIDSLKYKDLITKKVNALIYFKNDSILKLNHLDLKYKHSTVNINGNINAHSSLKDSLNNNPFDLNFVISAKGKSADLNDYLKTKNFIFKTGDFEFTGNYKTQAEELGFLNAKGSGDLKISHSILDYEIGGLEIPVDSLHVQIANDVATLKTLDINLPGKSSVFFSGYINHFSDFINNEITGEAHSSKFSIYSPYLDSGDIVKFLANAQSNKKQVTESEFSLQRFKEAMNGIKTSFYPKANITIDSLTHADLALTNLRLDFLFDNKENFNIKDTHLDFYGGSIDVDVDVGLKNKDVTPVQISMQLESINLHELVTRFDYFDDDALREADKIEGRLNFDIKITGSVNNSGKLNMNSLNGQAHLDLSNVLLYNYKPIIENSKFIKDKRFQKLSFRPIVQTFDIVNGVLIIPQTEIQSSAIHLFAEGRLKFDEYINIWLSLPWKNLKSNDGLILPEKTTYNNAGSKFFVQLIQDKTKKKEKNQKLKVKFRLGNGKLKKLRKTQN